MTLFNKILKNLKICPLLLILISLLISVETVISVSIGAINNNNLNNNYNNTPTRAATDPVIFLQQITDKLLLTLKQQRALLTQQPNRVYLIVNQQLMPHVNSVLVARSVAGRTAWSASTVQQQRAFQEKLMSAMVKTYASALNRYTNETVVYRPLRGISNSLSLSTVQVDSQILSNNSAPIAVSYRLIKDNASQQWLIYDMIVEGVSLLESFRTQVQAELNQGMTLAQITQQLGNNR